MHEMDDLPGYMDPERGGMGGYDVEGGFDPSYEPPRGQVGAGGTRPAVKQFLNIFCHFDHMFL